MDWFFDRWHIIFGWTAKAFAFVKPVSNGIKTVLGAFNLAEKNVSLTQELEMLKADKAHDLSRISELEEKICGLNSRLEPPRRRHELEEKLLIIAASKGRVHSTTLSREVGVHTVTSQYHFQELLNDNMIALIDGHYGGTYRLSHAGRTYLVRNGLVPPPEPEPPRPLPQRVVQAAVIAPAPGSARTEQQK